jgi:hypothetical protein
MNEQSVSIYMVKVKVEDTTGPRTKFRTETFGVKAMSATEVEAKMYEEYKGFPEAWVIKSIVQTPILKIIE